MTMWIFFGRVLKSIFANQLNLPLYFLGLNYFPQNR